MGTSRVGTSGSPEVRSWLLPKEACPMLGDQFRVITVSKAITLLEKEYFHDMENVTDNYDVIDGRLTANYKGR